MRHNNGLGGRSIDRDVLRALDRVPRKVAVGARELADSMEADVFSVAPKLKGLVKAGLARLHWGPDHSPGRRYAITDEGRDHLMRLEQRDARARERAERD